jgi:integrase
MRELLSELCHGAEGEYLFTNGAERRLNRSAVDFHFRQACRRAGISGFRFHDLRHEYGSRLGDADVNLKKISRLMGHSDTKMTERYVHPDEDSLLAAAGIAARPSSRIVPHRLRVVG